MTLREIFIKLGLDLDAQSFAKGALAAKAIESGFGAIARAANIAGREMAHMLLGAVERGDKLDEMSQKLGVNAQTLQRLAFAGSFSGLTLDSVGQSLKFFNKHLAATGRGSADAEVELAKVADRFRDMPDGPNKVRLALKLFGKAGLDMVPLLNQGAAAVERLMDEADDLGLVMGEDAVKQAAALDDSMVRLKATWEGIKVQVGTALMPVLQRVLTWAFDWWRQNKELVKSGLVTVFKALFRVGKLLYKFVLHPMGVALEWVIDHWKMFKLIALSVFAALTPAIVAFGAKALVAGLTAAAGWLAAIAPLLIMTGIILLAILLIDDFVTFLRGGDSVLGRVLAKVDQWTRWDVSDSTFMKGLKTVIETLFHLPSSFMEAWTEIFRLVGKFFDWLDEKLNSVLPKIKSLPGVKGKVDEATGAAGIRRATDTIIGRAAGLNPDVAARVIGRVAAGTPLFPGHVAPQVAPGGRAAGNVTQTNHLTISVERGAGGKDEDSLVDKIRDHVEDFFTTKMRETADAVAH